VNLDCVTASRLVTALPQEKQKLASAGSWVLQWAQVIVGSTASDGRLRLALRNFMSSFTCLVTDATTFRSTAHAWMELSAV
jgi:hypothetical protein